MEQLSATRSARALVCALVSQGVCHVVVCPGSRSAPLAFAFADAAAAGFIQLRVVADERTGAFIALGLAQFGPAAVVTTSGTAVANLHPAVLEASHSNLPLVAITADRPHRLRAVGANQTTDQVGIFGTAVRAAVDLPAGQNPTQHTIRLLASARGGAFGLGSMPGPVHLNVSFDGDLAPDTPWRSAREELAAPATRVVSLPPLSGANPLTAPGESGQHSADAIVLDPRKRGVIVAGYGSEYDVTELAEKLGWPILAEPFSPARRTPWAAPDYHSTLAQLHSLIEAVLVVGRPTLNRDITALTSRTDIPINVLAAGGVWPDISGVAAMVSGSVVVKAELPAPGWAQQWLNAPSARPPQWGMAQAMWDILSTSGALFIGSSLPVRAADRHGPVGEQLQAGPIYASRGLAGIDGSLATATGIALGSAAPIRAVVGDVTFAHDAMSLLHGVGQKDVDLTVVLLDNGGGKIFRELEYGAPQYQPYLPALFDTAQALDVEAFAAAVGAKYELILGGRSLQAALAHEPKGRSILHVQLPQDH